MFTAPEPWLAWGTASAPASREGDATIAVPRDYVDWATIQIGQILGRDLVWQPSEVRLRDAIRIALAQAQTCSADCQGPSSAAGTTAIPSGRL